MRLTILSLILGVFAVGTADADSCRVQRVVVHHAPVHHAVAAIVTPIPVATYLPIQVAVPTYSVGVAPQQVQQATQPDAVLGAIEKLTLAVERLGAGQPQALAATAPQSLAHLQILTARCASCHEKAVAQAKGGNLVLLDGGKEVQLTARQIIRVLATTHDGTMPKSGAKLNAAEKRAISQWIEAGAQ